MGQAGVAERLFDDLERIRLTAVVFLDRPISADRRSKHLKPQKKSIYLFVILLLVPVCIQSLGEVGGGGLGSVRDINAFSFDPV